MFGSKDLLFSSETYGVAKSLRFRSGSTTYFNRTFSTPTNQNTWTLSWWMKIGKLGTTGDIFSAGTTNRLEITYSSTGSLNISDASTDFINTNNLLRDPSAWYHCVVKANGTGAALQVYVNGVLTSNSTTNNLTTSYWNASGVVHYIGALGGFSSKYFDGYMAEVNFIDGQALTPSAFGFYDNNGIWQPKGYTGTYGTNGFYLKFTDVGATSGANTGYGQDFSGNGNYWTTNNFGTTSTSSTYDSMLDSPTNATGDIGNYCVLNPLYGATPTLADGNLSATTNATTAYGSMSVTSGKWYWEITVGNASYIGVIDSTYTKTDNGWSSQVLAYQSNGNKYNGTSSAYGSSYTTNHVIGIALDMDGGTITFYNNNVSQGTAYSSGVSGKELRAMVYSGASGTQIANFGQRPFAYTPPSGYSALNTQNLTTPTITNGAAYMAAVTYTGSASTQNVTATSTNSGNNPNAVTFQPDLVWIKDRTNAQSHKLTDAVRGTTKAISTDSTAAEATDANGVTAFNNNGFSLGTGTRAYSDSNLDSYVAWQWKEGVSQGFDIVSYAGDNTSNRNISHNLGVAPAFAWVKSLSTGSFYIYHQNLTGSTYFLKCNSTDGTNAQTNTNTPWGTGNWSSTQFMVTNNATNNLNASSTNYIGYLWAAIAGYSAFGSYAGNSSSDGPFVYTGFRPRYVMIKAITTGSVESWELWDTSRSPYNVVSLQLFANTSAAESDGSARPCILDILSNGFKIRGTNSEMNSSSYSYAYAAFAENPFKISRAR